MSKTYIEPRLGALAFRINDWPETPTVCSTPGMRWARDSMRAITRLGALDRGGIGELDVEEQVPLVLLRDEPGGGAIEDEVRQTEQARRKRASTIALSRSTRLIVAP